jgi:hypothetical protein
MPARASRCCGLCRLQEPGAVFGARYVCFGQLRTYRGARAGRQWASKRLMHRSKRPLGSITKSAASHDVARSPPSSAGIGCR